MSLEFKPSEKLHSFGHHFMVGLSGPVLAREDKEILKRIHPIGIYFSSKNFLKKPYHEWFPVFRQLLTEAHKYTEREKVLTILDFEVQPLPAPFHLWPHGSKTFPAHEPVIDCVSSALRSLGMNLWLGPRVDGRRDEAGDQDIDLVCEQLAIFLRSMHRSGLTTALRYFPGYDGASRTLRESMGTFAAALPQHALKPFRMLASFRPMITIVAHHHYPQLDPMQPASFSERIVRGILRGEYGYQGVAMSDDADMLSVAERFHVGKGAPQAIRASVDLFLISRLSNPFGNHPVKIAQSIYESLRTKEITEQLLFDSFERINDLVIATPQSGPMAPLNVDSITKLQTALGMS